MVFFLKGTKWGLVGYPDSDNDDDNADPDSDNDDADSDSDNDNADSDSDNDDADSDSDNDDADPDADVDTDADDFDFLPQPFTSQPNLHEASKFAIQAALDWYQKMGVVNSLMATLTPHKVAPAVKKILQVLLQTLAGKVTNTAAKRFRLATNFHAEIGRIKVTGAFRDFCFVQMEWVDTQESRCLFCCVVNGIEAYLRTFLSQKCCSCRN